MSNLEKDSSGALRVVKDGRIDPPGDALCVAYRMADFAGAEWVYRYFQFDRRGSSQFVLMHDGTMWDDEAGIGEKGAMSHLLTDDNRAVGAEYDARPSSRRG